MNETRERLDLALGAMTGDVSEVQGRVHVPAVLARLAQEWNAAAWTDEQRADIEALCRKIHVARRVFATYDAGWKRPDRDPDLAPADWPACIEVLLAYAHVPEGSDEEQRGRAFKCVNAAFAAIDLARKGGANNLEDIAERAAAVLRSSVEALVE